MSSSVGKARVTDSGLSVRYTPCDNRIAESDSIEYRPSDVNGDNTDEDIDEISVIDEKPEEGHGSASDESHSDEEGIEKECHENPDVQSEKTDTELNGPKTLPGSVLSVASSPNDKTKLIGERLSSRTTLSSPINSNRYTDPKSYRSRTTSRQSIFELVRVRTSRKPSRDDHFNLMKKVRSNETVASKEVRKQRRKDIATRFGKKSIRSDTRFDNATTVSESDGCNWTFVFDPSGRLSYWWSSVVSIAFIYNFWVIIYRFAFQEISSHNISIWFTLDYLADFIYILDIAFHFRTGYLEDGVLQTDATKLRLHYMNTTNFYVDCLCLLPLDFLYLSIGFCSILRCSRLVKVYRFWMFLDRTERHTNYPNVIRTTTLMHYLLALFHWNACLYYIIANRLGKSSTTWEFPKDNGDVMRQYLHALYWSTLTLTTVGNLPRPKTNGDYVFTIFEMVFGLLLFATVLGHISNIVSCISAARKDFQEKLDNVKTYMSLRRVPLRLQDRVIKWFDYLCMCNKSTDEEKTLSILPDKLKAEKVIHVHLDTLKRVEIFQQTEAGFLFELVLNLDPDSTSPGDYICRKVEVGKEMYIDNRGRLNVVGDNGNTVLATLNPGSYFGEISILNMGTSGNRRTASVRSVGYSDLFRLSKQGLWDVLKEYLGARVKLEAIAVMRLKKTEKKPIETALTRSKSTSGLVESTDKTPFNGTFMTRHHNLPSGMPTLSASTELPQITSELEMQMTCTSDIASTGSTDDRSNPFEYISRESMI
ncbi:cyclic nucleotide-gated cation channel alpha-3-like [Dreissena polymorpha]|uniref:cyclic nucleotide-gated cation channel alpha-3-like n=1 Tax=Dreissena polymorpha TaxID=45954 RepID=UPI0022642875|nr:cyclic nucleotide-gated cation channel alpha-3-like [Dreissena polymorpha]